jgi:heat shock protein HtpX
MALSRSRELEADRWGADLAGSGEPLARALEKLGAYAARVPMDIAHAQAQRFIVNPLTGQKGQLREPVPHPPHHRGPRGSPPWIDLRTHRARTLENIRA